MDRSLPAFVNCKMHQLPPIAKLFQDIKDVATLAGAAIYACISIAMYKLADHDAFSIRIMQYGIISMLCAFYTVAFFNIITRPNPNAMLLVFVSWNLLCIIMSTACHSIAASTDDAVQFNAGCEYAFSFGAIFLAIASVDLKGVLGVLQAHRPLQSMPWRVSPKASSTAAIFSRQWTPTATFLIVVLTSIALVRHPASVSRWGPSAETKFHSP